MLGKVCKSVGFVSMLGLSLVGAMTFVPDEKWESFPPALLPVRAQLAKIGVAPIKYREGVAQEVDEELEDSADNMDNEAIAEVRPARSQVRIGARSARADSKFERQKLERSSYDLDDIDDSYRSVSRDATTRGSRVDVAANDDKPSRFTGTSTTASPTNEEKPAGITQDDYDEADDEFITDESFARADLFDQEDSFDDAPYAAAPVAAAAQNVAQNDNAQDVTTADYQDDYGYYPDEPGMDTNKSLDDLLVDRAALNDAPPAVSPAQAASTAQVAPTNLAEATQGPSALSPAASQNLTETLAVSSATSFRDGSSLEPAAPIAAAPVAANVRELSDQQGYLTPNAAQTAPAEKVQSFDDYLNESNARAQVKPAAELAPPASQGYIAETSAVMPVSKPADATDLNALLRSLSQSPTDEQTRAIFLTLNRYYDSQYKTASPQDQANAIRALDHLAYEAFYSPKRSILEAPRVVREGDTLVMIAREYNVNLEYLAGVNGLDPNAPLVPGTALKTARGPVSAELSVGRKELTLRINGMYAGRFKCGVPEVSTAVRGRFLVDRKLLNPSCDAVGADGSPVKIAGGDPNNPLGACWISLQNGPGLQGTNRPELVGTYVQENGGFIFSNQEISQLNALLQIGSTITFVD